MRYCLFHLCSACFIKGLASYCQAKTTFTFHFSILALSNAFLSINNRKMKSESGFSFAMASKPLLVKMLQLLLLFFLHIITFPL